jgi:hypothetical protein
MTGRLVNEKIQMKILKLLYDNRKNGEPIVLNKFWKENIEKTVQIRITLQYLFKDKEYIWCENHREIGNAHNNTEQTLENTSVIAKITETGIEYYRNERNVKFNYWSIRLSLFLSILSFIISTYNILTIKLK